MVTATGAVLAAWMAQAVAATLGCALYLRLLRRPQPRPSDAPPVLVAVPVRGGAGLDAFLSALAAQNYPRWRVAFAVEDRSDPAFPLLARFAAARPSCASVVEAGAASARGQKVQNLLAALPALRPDDAALVTLDADTAPPPDALAELLRPILSGQADLSSGYRWTLPAAAGAGPLLLSLAEAGVATLPRCARCNLCWGGATAVGRRALERLDLPRLWARAVSDDMSLSRAAHRAGLVIYAPLTVRPPSPARPAGVADALLFGVRQHRLMRLHTRGRWLLAGLLLALPVGGGAVAAVSAATGNGAALACLGVAWLLQRVRAALRGAIARRVLPADAAAEAESALRRGRWWQPVAHALHLLAWIGSAAGRHLDWAGRRYRLGPDGEVLGIERLPNGRPAGGLKPRRPPA